MAIINPAIGGNKMNYEELSDFEINKLVAEALGYESPTWRSKHSKETSILVHRKGMPTRDVVDKYDPCNNWSDIGAIIEENKISVSHAYDAWFALADYQGFGSYNVKALHENPKRAAAICFLKMQGGNK